MTKAVDATKVFSERLAGLFTDQSRLGELSSLSAPEIELVAPDFEDSVNTTFEFQGLHRSLTEQEKSKNEKYGQCLLNLMYENSSRLIAALPNSTYESLPRYFAAGKIVKHPLSLYYAWNPSRDTRRKTIKLYMDKTTQTPRVVDNLTYQIAVAYLALLNDTADDLGLKEDLDALSRLPDWAKKMAPPEVIKVKDSKTSKNLTILNDGFVDVSFDDAKKTLSEAIQKYENRKNQTGLHEHTLAWQEWLDGVEKFKQASGTMTADEFSRYQSKMDDLWRKVESLTEVVESPYLDHLKSKPSELSDEWMNTADKLWEALFLEPARVIRTQITIDQKNESKEVYDDWVKAAQKRLGLDVSGALPSSRGEGGEQDPVEHDRVDDTTSSKMESVTDVDHSGKPRRRMFPPGYNPIKGVKNVFKGRGDGVPKTRSQDDPLTSDAGSNKQSSAPQGFKLIHGAKKAWSAVARRVMNSRKAPPVTSGTSSDAHNDDWAEVSDSQNAFSKEKDLLLQYCQDYKELGENLKSKSKPLSELCKSAEELLSNDDDEFKKKSKEVHEGNRELMKEWTRRREQMSALVKWHKECGALHQRLFDSSPGNRGAFDDYFQRRQRRYYVRDFFETLLKFITFIKINPYAYQTTIEKRKRYVDDLKRLLEAYHANPCKDSCKNLKSKIREELNRTTFASRYLSTFYPPPTGLQMVGTFKGLLKSVDAWIFKFNKDLDKTPLKDDEQQSLASTKKKLN